MNDDDLRALVRESIAKQLGGQTPRRQAPVGPAMVDQRLHASHGVYGIARLDAPYAASGNLDDGPCIIEPSVPCTHCNYCKSHGH
ncbi:MAG: hypothetical protein M3Q55_14095 [Acidobacteriota bacterium]|nr:hypothetical protein [Acidobacteriota bacterium]